MPEYRPLPEARNEEFGELLTYAFRPQAGPGGTPDEDELPPDMGEKRGTFEGDDLLAVCRHYFWDGRVRGESVGLAGLTAVASPPESRRRGVVGEMLVESLREYRDRDYSFAALWPFKRSFYARYGWATANEYAKLDATVDALSFAESYAEGEFRPADRDDWERLDRVYRAHADRYSLTVNRTREWWRGRVFQSYGTDPYVYLYERDGDPAGYLVYVVDDDDGRTFRVYEAGFVDFDAFLNLVRFTYYHDSQVEDVDWYGAADGELRDLLDLVDDPGDLEYEVHLGPMIRLVDVERALEAIPYPGSVDRRVVIDVTDEHAEWNDGRFVLDVSGGSADCRRVDSSAADPDVSVDVGTLSQLAVGYRSVDALSRVGSLAVADEETATDLAAAFPTADSFLRDGF